MITAEENLLPCMQLEVERLMVLLMVVFVVNGEIDFQVWVMFEMMLMLEM